MSDPAPASPFAPTSTTPEGRASGWLGLCCALAVLALTFALVPEYWQVRGFPLDDAWIHAVYARGVAHGEGLSYNPGVPATGETSPLWAVVLAVAHLGQASVGRAVLVTKLLGFLLHALTAAGLYVALRDAGRRWALSAALLVLVSPHLVAASISGMEVPLATLAAVSFLLVLRSQRPGLYVLCGALGPLARPEVGLFLVLLPLVVRPRPGWKPLLQRWLEAAAGLVLGGGAWAAWNLHASGRPLPATFYAKVQSEGSLLLSQWTGFSQLVPEVSWPWPVLLVLVALALRAAFRRHAASGPERLAAGLVALALVFCSVSQVLLRTKDIHTFYAWRYVLPAVPFLLAALPVLLGGWLESRLARHGPRLPMWVAVLLPLVMATGLPQRLSWLENDAHNIDDLQVQQGLALADASPEDVVWVLDAGASRFFGKPFVVDMIGLNTPQLLGEGAQAYLREHPPRFFDWVSGWAIIQADTGSKMGAKRFQTTTPYTVTSQEVMAERLLVECPPGVAGEYLRTMKRWRFQCAAGSPAGTPMPPPPPPVAEEEGR